MSDAHDFLFIDDPAQFALPATRAAQPAHVVRIPPNIRTKQQLLACLARELQFPPHFGHNWDALEECLRDLSWLPPDAPVVLIHESLPNLTDDQSLRTYLQILRDVSRKPATRRIQAVFPTRGKSRIESLLPGEPSPLT